jgi:hypothetical protein
MKVKDGINSTLLEIEQTEQKLDNLQKDLADMRESMSAKSEFATFVYRTDQGQLGGYAAVVARSREEANEKMKKLGDDTPGINSATLELVLDQNGTSEAIIWHGEY